MSEAEHTDANDTGERVECCLHLDRGDTRDHLAAIDGKISQLAAMREELQRMLDCCSGGRVAECRTTESIGRANEMIG